MRVTLMGVDPGIRDTAFMSITLDSEQKKFWVRDRVWTDVSRMVKENFVIKQSFLDELADEVRRAQQPKVKTLKAVEGYRNRGNNMRQDQQMTLMVRTIANAIKGSTVVDNTGVKNVVKPKLLKSFNFRFKTTNHADLNSAARIALRLGLTDEDVNRVLSDYVLDHLMDEPWSKV